MSASVLAPGLVVADSYEVERQLGQGGMGEVWLAQHRRLAGKQVAIKVLRTGGQLPTEALARFRREAEIAARLEHPNIVQVLDFNTLPSGEPFLVMEYLKGVSLAQRLRSAPLPLEEVLDVVRQVGAALQAAHAGGVVHRDLKPENIFLVPTALGDQVKVLDFGISKIADSHSVQTTDAVLIGTPLYMSPEQALGNNREVSAQSDVFSLASITYEALTGAPPFLADSIAKIVFRIAYEKHRPLLDVRPDLPPAIAQAVERGLAKDRAQRTPDMGTFVAELTGRALAVPRHEPVALNGVHTPAMPESASLAGGDTLPRGSSARTAPPPAEGAAGATSPASASRPSLALIVGLLLVALAAAGLLLRPATPAASATSDRAVAATTEVPDAAVAAPSEPAAADASALPLAPLAADTGAGTSIADAGARAADAPSAAPPRPRPGRSDPSGPMTDAEREYLANLAQLLEQRKYEQLLFMRNAVPRALSSAPARFQALRLLIRAACINHDDRVMTGFVEALRAQASSSTYAAAKRECLTDWPDAALRWE